MHFYYFQKLLQILTKPYLYAQLITINQKAGQLIRIFLENTVLLQGYEKTAGIYYFEVSMKIMILKVLFLTYFFTYVKKIILMQRI